MSASEQNLVVPVGTQRDLTYVDVYSNQIRLGVTLGDVMIIFGAIEDIGPNQMIIKDKAAVRLSPITAKILMINLQAAIEAYEKGVGEIPIPHLTSQSARAISNSVPEMLREQISGPARA